MKQLTVIIVLSFAFFGFAQKDAVLKGKIICDDLGVLGIEIINLRNEVSTISDAKGNFAITAKESDELVFYSKKYKYKSVVVKQEYFNSVVFLVVIEKNPEELEEVTIFKAPSFKNVNYSDDEAAHARIAKQAVYPKNNAVYDGTIPNGMNFVQIGRMLIGLFAKDKEPIKKHEPEIPFNIYAKQTFAAHFYSNQLHIEPEQVDLFLDYCTQDSASKQVFINKNELTLLDFLYKKAKEFKALAAVTK